MWSCGAAGESPEENGVRMNREFCCFLTEKRISSFLIALFYPSNLIYLKLVTSSFNLSINHQHLSDQNHSKTNSTEIMNFPIVLVISSCPQTPALDIISSKSSFITISPTSITFPLFNPQKSEKYRTMTKPNRLTESFCIFTSLRQSIIELRSLSSPKKTHRISLRV